MRSAPPRFLQVAVTLFTVCVPAASVLAGANAQEDTLRISPPVRRLLYVAEPGIRDYLEYGGHGLLVFDIDHGHTFVKRIPTAGLDAAGKPLNVKGVCANAATKKIYVSTTQQLMCLDLVTEKLLWEKKFDRGCDRMSMTPDGALIFLPSFEGPVWYVVRASDGEELARITPDSGAHNTVAGHNGKEAYLAGLKSPLLTVADTASHRAIRTVGPFSASIRPFTVNGQQTLCFVNVNELLGFEIGDLVAGKKLHRVEVQGFKKGPTKRHGCPSHGIGLTPDEKELWLTDSFNTRVHIFDATVMPPVQVASIVVRDEPGWVTFSIDGRYAYPSTGDVIDTRTRKIVTLLKDELVRNVQSEKMVEIDFKGTEPVQTGDQFGLGRFVSGNQSPASSR
jgi:DNA-binding beta-propeller fold protein YncE